jgi:hypothetical protein
MPSKHPPLPGTLASFAECGRPVFIICGNCNRSTRPRYEQIARSAGWAAKVEDIGRRLRCEKCGHRGARFTFERPSGRIG